MTIGHNTIKAQDLLKYIERIEAKQQQIKQLQQDVKLIKAEAAATGFDGKGVAFCVKVRKQTPSEFREAEDMRDMYLHAIGMGEQPPLFKYLEGLAGKDFGEGELVEKMKGLVPAGGSITVNLPGGKPMKVSRDSDGNVTVEEVKPEPKAAPSSRVLPAQPPAAPVPDADAEGAEALGRQAAKDNKAIIANPFPYGDERRARWDLGWRKETGNDGMGADEDDD